MTNWSLLSGGLSTVWDCDGDYVYYMGGAGMYRWSPAGGSELLGGLGNWKDDPLDDNYNFGTLSGRMGWAFFKGDLYVPVMNDKLNANGPIYLQVWKLPGSEPGTWTKVLEELAPIGGYQVGDGTSVYYDQNVLTISAKVYVYWTTDGTTWNTGGRITDGSGFGDQSPPNGSFNRFGMMAAPRIFGRHAMHLIFPNTAPITPPYCNLYKFNSSTGYWDVVQYNYTAYNSNAKGIHSVDDNFIWRDNNGSGLYEYTTDLEITPATVWTQPTQNRVPVPTYGLPGYTIGTGDSRSVYLWNNSQNQWEETADGLIFLHGSGTTRRLMSVWKMNNGETYGQVYYSDGGGYLNLFIRDETLPDLGPPPPGGGYGEGYPSFPGKLVAKTVDGGTIWQVIADTAAWGAGQVVAGAELNGAMAWAMRSATAGDIPNKLLWLDGTDNSTMWKDADQNEPVTEFDDSVHVWKNLIDNTLFVAPTSNHRPVWTAESVRYISNNLDPWDPSTHYGSLLVANPAPSLSGPLTYFMVLNHYGGGVSQVMFSGDGSQANSHTLRTNPTGGENASLILEIGDSISIELHDDNYRTLYDKSHAILIILDGANSAAYINGVASAANPFNAGSVTMNGLILGGLYDQPPVSQPVDYTKIMNGNIFEFMVIDWAVTQDEIDALFDYAQSKHGL